MKYEKFEEWMLGKKVTHVYAESSGVIMERPDEDDPDITVRVKYDEGDLAGDTLGAFLRNLEFLEEKPSEEVGVQENSRINWEEGQIVYCLIRGKGQVNDVGRDSVVVWFDKVGAWKYTDKGELLGYEGVRTLFFSEPVITAELFPPKKPFVPTLKKGDKIFIRTKSGIYSEGVVREVFSEVEDRVYISEDMHYFMKYDIESIHILGEEIKFQ